MKMHKSRFEISVDKISKAYTCTHLGIKLQSLFHLILKYVRGNTRFELTIASALGCWFVKSAHLSVFSKTKCKNHICLVILHSKVCRIFFLVLSFLLSVQFYGIYCSRLINKSRLQTAMGQSGMVMWGEENK